MRTRLFRFALILTAIFPLLVQNVWGATAEEINIGVDAALERFNKHVDGADKFLAASESVLVFPKVIKAGLGIGGEYGEGALRINGKTVDYYSTAAGSIGLQIGAQSKTVIVVFMQEKALEDFRAASGWKAGVDGSINLIEVGAAGSIDTTNIKDPILGFVMTNAGLMANVTLEGSKYTKIVR